MEFNRSKSIKEFLWLIHGNEYENTLEWEDFTQVLTLENYNGNKNGTYYEFLFD